ATTPIPVLPPVTTLPSVRLVGFRENRHARRPLEALTPVIRPYNARVRHQRREFRMLKRGQRVSGLFILTALLLGATGTARAQSTGTLRGTVTDAQGAVTPGVSIVIRNQATGVERTVASDASGAYVAASLPPGFYRVEAQLQGFQTQTKDVQIDV